MEPDKIQQRALSTWYEDDHELQADFLPSTLGLVGEAGEFADLIKKMYFKPGHSAANSHLIGDLVDELGDVLYYVAVLAWQLGVTLDELSRMNEDKLRARESNHTGYNRGREK